MKTRIDKAGKYDVIQHPCPHFTEKVNLNGPRTGILHTTEGSWCSSMGVFDVHFAPQFLVGINACSTAAHRSQNQQKINSTGPTGNVEIAQLVDVGTIGAAIRTHNNVALVQIEMIGYSKETLWIPDAETVDALASLMLVCHDEWGIPISRPWPTGTYGRAGKTAHRNEPKFGKIAGWYGHGDCPSPDTHWDPGNLNWDAIFARAHELDAETKKVVAKK